MALLGAGTRCNLSHCGWYSAAGLQLVPADPLAWRTRVQELRVSLQHAGPKGLGVFAAQTAGPGRTPHRARTPDQQTPGRSATHTCEPRLGQGGSAPMRESSST
eukprot:scaffold49440_cov58-Phaeocystis_antarctica.AAC.4